jgi:hypothetical protein
MGRAEAEPALSRTSNIFEVRNAQELRYARTGGRTEKRLANLWRRKRLTKEADADRRHEARWDIPVYHHSYLNAGCGACCRLGCRLDNRGGTGQRPNLGGESCHDQLNLPVLHRIVGGWLQTGDRLGAHFEFGPNRPHCPVRFGRLWGNVAGGIFANRHEWHH